MAYMINVKTTHKLFGTNEITGKTKGLINTDEEFGVVVGKYKIFGNKKDKNFFVKRSDTEMIIRDDLMEIYITAASNIGA